MRIETTCRSCGAGELVPILSLGHVPLANRLLDADQLRDVEPVYPLDWVRCRRCTLVQITATISPDELFRHYVYFSSCSDDAVRQAEALSAELVAKRGLGRDNLVIEVGSNDGYLLGHYQRAGVGVLGIEPAANVAHFAMHERQIPTVCEFFGRALADELRDQGRFADVVHINNVLAHVADLDGVVAGLEQVLKENGVISIEVPYLLDLVAHTEFDTIYHEHLCYFSLQSLTTLLQRHGLYVVDVQRIAAHGGSLRVFAGKSDAPSARSQHLLEAEQQWHRDADVHFARFVDQVTRLRRELCTLLDELKADGKRIAVYGASAKGSTLLNYFQLGAGTLEYAVDRNRVKQGRYMPGSHLRIHAPDELLHQPPDYSLLLSWNLAGEVLEQQAAYRRQGGRFIIPIPELKVA